MKIPVHPIYLNININGRLGFVSKVQFGLEAHI